MGWRFVICLLLFVSIKLLYISFGSDSAVDLMLVYPAARSSSIYFRPTPSKVATPSSCFMLGDSSLHLSQVALSLVLFHTGLDSRLP